MQFFVSREEPSGTFLEVAEWYFHSDQWRLPVDCSIGKVTKVWFFDVLASVHGYLSFGDEVGSSALFM